MRFICLLIGLLMTSPAIGQPTSASNATPDTLIVELTPQRGYGPFEQGMGEPRRAHEPGDAWYGLRGTTQGVPDTLQDGQLGFQDFDFWQLAYQRYREGALPPEQALDVLSEWGIDTLSLSPEPVNVSVAVFSGRDAEGSHVFIFDTDNDEDLSDEQALTLPAEKPEGIPWYETGASAKVAFEIYDGERIKQDSAFVRITPYEIPKHGRYLISTDRYYTGETQTEDGRTLEWFATHGYSWGIFRRENTRVALFTGAEGEPRSVAEGYEPYLVEQMLEVDGRFYRIDHVTPGGERLVLVEASSTPDEGLRVGMTAPEIEATTLAGEPFRLSDLRGKYVLLDFWGTWCAPCIAEVPSLKWADRVYGGERFQIVGIAKDEPGAVEAFMERLGLAWPQIIQEEDRAILDAYRVQGFPTTFLIGPDGKIVAKDSELRGTALMDTLSELLDGE